jgi:hypothetical protein
MFKQGPGSSVGIATSYGLDGPGIESRWRRDFSHTSRPALGPTQPPGHWVPGLSRGSSGRGVVLTTHPLLAPRSRKSRAIPLPPLPGLSSLLRGTFTFKCSNVMAQGNNNGSNVRYLKRRRSKPSQTGVRITNEAYQNQQSDYSRLIPN